MNMRRKKRSTVESGYDSFLDIVANLVGILIILVVVLGTRSQQAIDQIREQEDAAPRASEVQLDTLAEHSMRAAAAQADSDRFEQRLEQYDRQIALADRRRDQLLDLLSQAEAAWQEKKKELDRRAVEAAERKTEYEQVRQELTKLRGQKERLKAQSSSVVAVAHLPTPMAKTVFGDEIHFRLKDNRLSVVPIDRLLEEIRRDLERVIDGSSDGAQQAAVGPVRGYVARYEMNKDRQMVRQNGRVGMATRVQLVGMTVEPLEPPHGEPIQRVLAGDSRQLDVELAGRDPAATTITVWVYPDSFASFRKLKEHLYARGFATAARPLPHGRPITGSPQGSRSRAQ